MDKKYLRIILESFFLSAGFILLGYIWNTQDPLFLTTQKHILPYVFVIVLLTLYYGLVAGIVSMLVFGLFLNFFYREFPYNTFFWYALLTFVLGEFHYFWQRKLNRYGEENSFLKEKIENLGRNFFMLKISHDQIEKNYVLKPLSIRSVLKEIRHMIINEDPNMFKNFLMLISRFTNVDSGSLYIKKGDNFVEVAKIGEGAELEMNDPLVEKAFEGKTAVYLSVSQLSDSNRSKYLSVLPVTDIDGNINGIMLITKMPFLSLNRDNLLSISVFLTYLFDEIFLSKSTGSLIKKYPQIPAYFIKELDRLIKLNRKYGIQSVIVVFYLKKEDFLESAFEQIEKNLRGLDLSARCSFGDKEKLPVVLPFTGDVNSIEFINRIKFLLKENLGEDIGKKMKHVIIPVGKFDLEETLQKIKEV